MTIAASETHARVDVIWRDRRARDRRRPNCRRRGVARRVRGTNVENPLPVDTDTLFQIGSITKTFTATALVRRAEQGVLDLDAPVRRYIPDLRLQNADVAGASRCAISLRTTAAGSATSSTTLARMTMR